jgi:radical SAM protein with 4Fe4S-binding SPASM domain
MSNKTIEMFTIRQVLRLYATGRGTKYISQSTGVARNTVKKYLHRYVQLKVTLEQLDKMSDAQMSKAFLEKDYVPIPNKRVTELEALLPSLASMLKKRGVTKQIVYDKYVLSCPDGFKHSAFLERLNASMRVGKGSMRMEHKAGDKMFVDFTGEKLHLVDKLSGEVTDVEVFVAILGCSQLTFVMASGNYSTFSPELLNAESKKYDGFTIGNVHTENFLDALLSEKFSRIYSDILKGIILCKKECKYFSVCGGGTPSNKYSENGTFDSSETNYCRFKFQKLFDIFLNNVETAVLKDQKNLYIS